MVENLTKKKENKELYISTIDRKCYKNFLLLTIYFKKYQVYLNKIDIYEAIILMQKHLDITSKWLLKFDYFPFLCIQKLTQIHTNFVLSIKRFLNKHQNGNCKI